MIFRKPDSGKFFVGIDLNSFDSAFKFSNLFNAVGITKIIGCACACFLIGPIDLADAKSKKASAKKIVQKQNNKTLKNSKTRRLKKVRKGSVAVKKNGATVDILNNRWFVAGHLGLIQVNKNSGKEPGAISGFGGVAGYHKDKWKYVFQFYQVALKTAEVAGIQENKDTFLLLGGNYQFRPNMYAGLKLGHLGRTMKVAGSGSGLSASGLGFGGELGYEFVLTDSVIFAINFIYLRALSSEATDGQTGFNEEFPGVDYFNYLGTVNYYF